MSLAQPTLVPANSQLELAIKLCRLLLVLGESTDHAQCAVLSGTVEIAAAAAARALVRRQAPQREMRFAWMRLQPCHAWAGGGSDSATQTSLAAGPCCRNPRCAQEQRTRWRSS